MSRIKIRIKSKIKNIKENKIMIRISKYRNKILKFLYFTQLINYI